MSNAMTAAKDTSYYIKYIQYILPLSPVTLHEMLYYALGVMSGFLLNVPQKRFEDKFILKNRWRYMHQTQNL